MPPLPTAAKVRHGLTFFCNVLWLGVFCFYFVLESWNGKWNHAIVFGLGVPLWLLCLDGVKKDGEKLPTLCFIASNVLVLIPAIGGIYSTGFKSETLSQLYPFIGSLVLALASIVASSFYFVFDLLNPQPQSRI